MSQIYQDGTYLANNVSWHEEDSPWKAKQIQQIIDANGLIPRTLCEVGCGAGEIINNLSQRYTETEFSGYEISSDAYEICSRKSNARLNFKLTDLLAESDVYFDIALAIDVFEHVEDYFGFLRRFKGVAEYKIFHIPLDLSVPTLLFASPITRKRETLGHLHYFTKQTALATLVDTGYEIVDYVYTASSVDLPALGWKQGLMKIPRRLAFTLSKDLAVRMLGGYSLLVLSK